MKFSFKVLICTTLVIAVVCSVGSYALVDTSFRSDIDREVVRGLDAYQLVRFAFGSNLVSAEIQYSSVTNEMMGTIIQQTAQAAGGQSIAVYNDAGRRLASAPVQWSFSIPVTDISENEQHYQITSSSQTYALEIAGSLVYDDRQYFLVLSRDVTDIFDKKEDLIRFFIYLDLIMIMAGALLMSGISYFLTRPIRQLKRSAVRIAAGRYHERATVRSKDEIGDMANSFNNMASAVEQNVADLKRHARQQEDFVANFSHELKTPLTSIIGYADMLRSEKLDSEDAFKAASFIFSEGKRLEVMSLKLMDIIVLEHQSFSLKRIAVLPLLERTVEVMTPLLAQSAMMIEMEAEEQIVSAEPDLLMTLLINLIDNGRKASEGGKVILTGKKDGRLYRIAVRDFGRGIPQQEIRRIKEAFYMVDKSRARAQHGAGLGLSIAERIAVIHGSSLAFESTVGEGTTVSFAVRAVAENDRKGEDEN